MNISDEHPEWEEPFNAGRAYEREHPGEETEGVKFHYTPAGWVAEKANSLKAAVFESDEADKLFAEVIERLNTGSDQLAPSDIGKEKLLTWIVMSLAWDYHAFIDGMYNDQWSAVSVKGPDFTVWVECYDLLAGAALAWKLVADHHEAKEE